MKDKGDIEVVGDPVFDELNVGREGYLWLVLKNRGKEDEPILDIRFIKLIKQNFEILFQFLWPKNERFRNFSLII